MNKTVRYIGVIILSALAGGVVGYLIKYFPSVDKINVLSNTEVVVISIIFSALVILCNLLMVKQLQKAKNFNKLSIAEEENADIYDRKLNEHFINSNWLNLSGYILSFVNLILINVGASLIGPTIIFSLLPLFINMFLTVIISIYLPHINSKAPKYNEPHYMDKLIQTYDEGDRHIMFSALFKIFNINIIGILFLICFTALYSSITQSNQLFTITCLILLFLINIVYYYVKTNKFYKE